MQLTPTRLIDGTWEGVLTGWSDEAPPALSARHRDVAVPGPEMTRLSPGEWLVRLTLPRQALAEGAQTIVIAGPDGAEVLAYINLIAGQTASLDVRAEVEMLRAELDLLKRAFRRHCVETGAAR